MTSLIDLAVRLVKEALFRALVWFLALVATPGALALVGGIAVAVAMVRRSPSTTRARPSPHYSRGWHPPDPLWKM